MANSENETVVETLSRELNIDEATALHILVQAAGANGSATKEDLVKEGILAAKRI